MREETRKQYLKLMGIELYQPQHKIQHKIQQQIRSEDSGEDLEISEEKPVSASFSEKASASSMLEADAPTSSVQNENDNQSAGADDDLLSYMAMDQALPDAEDEAPDEIEQAESADDLATLDWDQLQQRIAACEKCSLCQSRTQTVFGVGNPQADLMVIGEAPGAEEDKQGEPFVGAAGKLLDNMLKAIGLNRQKVFIANILKCRPPSNRNPSNEEAMACEAYLLRQIDLIQPKMVLSVGGVSAKNLLKTEEAVGRLRQQKQQMVKRKLPVLVTYHPAYLLRKPSEKAKSWEDLKKLKQMMKELDCA
jgi:uracil-DNA glycosylase family 4